MIDFEALCLSLKVSWIKHLYAVDIRLGCLGTLIVSPALSCDAFLDYKTSI